jgi:hypothetical protein
VSRSWFPDGALVRIQDDWGLVTALQRSRGGWVGQQRRAVMGRVAQVRGRDALLSLATISAQLLCAHPVV